MEAFMAKVYVTSWTAEDNPFKKIKKKKIGTKENWENAKLFS